MQKCQVTFDRSNEDIPTLVVSREAYFSLMPGAEVIKVITGDDAVRIWNELTGKTVLCGEVKPNDN